MTLPVAYTRVIEELESISPFDDLEKAHLEDATAWVKTGVNIFRVAKPDKPPKHLVSYFILVDPDHKSLLLGDHVKSQLWLPSGGHVEVDEDPKQTVIRECVEELGQPAVFLRGNERPFFLTVTKTNAFGNYHTDVSFWYVLRGNIHEHINFDRREFSDMTWYSFDEILESHPAIFDPHMQRFTTKLRNSLL